MKLFIYGAGGAGREIGDFLLEKNDNNSISFIDDYQECKVINDINVFKSRDIYDRCEDAKIEVVIALGEPLYRKKIAEELRAHNVCLAKAIIADSAEVSKYATLGKGIVIDRKTIVSPNVFIGENTYVNRGVIIGHDVKIGKNCVIGAGVIIGGHVCIADNTYVGSGVSIRDGVNIGEWCIVGIGSTVIKDIEDNKVVVGTPAKVIRDNDHRLVFN